MQIHNIPQFLQGVRDEVPGAHTGAEFEGGRQLALCDWAPGQGGRPAQGGHASAQSSAGRSCIGSLPGLPCKLPWALLHSGLI